jgi:hypothetical protein
MHPGKSLTRKRKKEIKIETASIQSGFVAAKGSVPVKSGKKQKLDEPENLSDSAKKNKGSSNGNGL